MDMMRIKIGKGPDYILMLGQTTIMHQMVVHVTENGKHSREVFSDASLYSLTTKVRSYVYAKDPSAILEKGKTAFARYKHPYRDLVLTCEIRWNEAVDTASTDFLIAHYMRYFFPAVNSSRS